MDAATVFLHLALPLRYGFFSDVHGDLEGLERALEALSEVDRLVFLATFWAAAATASVWSDCNRSLS